MRERGYKSARSWLADCCASLAIAARRNRKTLEGSSHPDRDAQFQYINGATKTAIANGEPVISVDTKKKELVGDFKNPGKELRRRGDPEPVRVHDFKIEELGKVAPYGVYDIAANPIRIEPVGRLDPLPRRRPYRDRFQFCRAINATYCIEKNSLFAGHDQGAQNWACLASLVETCLCRVRHKQVYAVRGTMPNRLIFPRIRSNRPVIGSA